MAETSASILTSDSSPFTMANEWLWSSSLLDLVISNESTLFVITSSIISSSLSKLSSFVVELAAPSSKLLIESSLVATGSIFAPIVTLSFSNLSFSFSGIWEGISLVLSEGIDCEKGLLHTTALAESVSTSSDWIMIFTSLAFSLSFNEKSSSFSLDNSWWSSKWDSIEDSLISKGFKLLLIKVFSSFIFIPELLSESSSLSSSSEFPLFWLLLLFADFLLFIEHFSFIIESSKRALLLFSKDWISTLLTTSILFIPTNIFLGSSMDSSIYIYIYLINKINKMINILIILYQIYIYKIKNNNNKIFVFVLIYIY